jgi:hypothetical protein
MPSIKLKINIGFNAYVAGSTVDVPADEHGTPLNRFWRDRLADAEAERERDPSCKGCVTIDQPAKPKKEPKPESISAEKVTHND